MVGPPSNISFQCDHKQCCLHYQLHDFKNNCIGAYTHTVTQCMCLPTCLYIAIYGEGKSWSMIRLYSNQPTVTPTESSCGMHGMDIEPITIVIEIIDYSYNYLVTVIVYYCLLYTSDTSAVWSGAWHLWWTHKSSAMSHVFHYIILWHNLYFLRDLITDANIRECWHNRYTQPHSM